MRFPSSADAESLNLKKREGETPGRFPFLRIESVLRS